MNKKHIISIGLVALFVLSTISLTASATITLIIPQPGPLRENTDYAIGVYDADTQAPLIHADVYWLGQTLHPNIYGACVIHTPEVDHDSTFLITASYNGSNATAFINVSNSIEPHGIRLIIPVPGPFYENQDYTVGVVDAVTNDPINNANIYWVGDNLTTNIYGACMIHMPFVSQTTTFPIIADYNGSTDSGNITVVPSGPNIPSNPSPRDNSTIFAGPVTLHWVGGSPGYNVTVYYDVFFNGAWVARNLSNTSYFVGVPRLGFNTWQIFAHDAHGGVTLGPLWQFRVILPTIKPTPTSIGVVQPVKPVTTLATIQR